MKRAVFCGTFDPFTLGHLDILKKAGNVFDKIYVAIPLENSKHSKSTAEARIKIAKESTKDLDFAEVVSFSGLLTDFCKAMKVYCLVRGIRNSSDYIYECDLLRNYQNQCCNLECVYFLPGANLSHISSSIVRELAALGGNIDGYVTDNVLSLISGIYGNK